jgi:alginate O-acetyltransferase complex protein AlgI
MVFSSSIFLFYFLPASLLLYFVVPYKWKNLMLLISSLFFFSWGAPRFVFILLLSITLDFYAGKLIFQSQQRSQKKMILLFSVLINLGLLVYFKYANFFVENLNAALQTLGARKMGWTSVALPIGISFFTFQKLSYVIDVYRNKKKALEKWVDFALYIALFPQLIAGPIIRYTEIADQLIDRRENLNIENKLYGFRRFVIGLSKKMLIANALGLQVDTAFSNGLQNLGTWDSWLLISAYALQIYFDFSGYSDMAIGIGRMLGFRIPENFKNPYIANSIVDFWRRWHMTLTNWFRDYLFFPLAFAFSKAMKKQKYLQIRADYWIYFFGATITFALTGFWHGASWNFLLWGVYHGFWIVADRFFLKKIMRKVGKPVSIVFTFFLVLMGWVLFRCESMPEIKQYFWNLYAYSPSTIDFAKSFWLAYGLGLSIAFLPAVKNIEQFFYSNREKEYASGYSVLRYTGIAILLILCMSEVVSTGFNPFIYFRF